MAYAGFLAGLGALALVRRPEYQHVSDLKLGLVGLAWSLLALTTGHPWKHDGIEVPASEIVAEAGPAH